MFHPLTKEEVKEIVDLMIRRVKTQLAAKGLDLELTDPLKGWLAEKGYDPQLGARPLRRTIQRELEDKLSERILFGEFETGQLIVADVDAEADEVIFRAVEAVQRPRHPADGARRRRCRRRRRRRGRPDAAPRTTSSVLLTSVQTRFRSTLVCTGRLPSRADVECAA